jgi:beta-glucosidase
VVDGLKAVAGPGVEIDYEQGCQLKGDSAELLPKAVAKAKDADAIIAVVGHSRGQLGENLDRDDLGLVGGQEKLVEEMQATGRPLVVVFQNGAPISSVWISEHAPAILESWYLGQATGTALAQTLFGEVNPGGKMPVSVARGVGQIPCYYNHPTIHGPVNYYGAKAGNLYPFGHGLSYTTFQYGDLKVEPPQIDPKQTTTVSLTVQNNGPREGDEVVQLYLRQDFTSLKRPVKELKGFQRVTLKPGEKREVSFQVGFEQLKFWKDGGWAVEPGEISIMAGSSSEDIRQKGKLVLQ